jgi:hypothetical protein
MTGAARRAARPVRTRTAAAYRDQPSSGGGDAGVEGGCGAGADVVESSEADLPEEDKLQDEEDRCGVPGVPVAPGAVEEPHEATR